MIPFLKVLQYELLYDDDARRSVTLELCYGINAERWAIRSGSDQCLGKTPDDDGYYLFSFESMPSSRNDDYYAEYRWPTAESAYGFWLMNRGKILATNEERVARWRSSHA